MARQQLYRWRPTRRQLLWASGIATLAFLIIVTCGYLFGWKWTGLPKKTLWDWLNLLVVPAVLALGGYLFTRSENRRTREAADEQRALDRQIADEQRSLDREIADERRQDDTLQAYLDGMSQLLTDKERPLHRAQPGDSLSTLARARTLTVLSRLDGERKGRIVQFLYESGLIVKGRPVLNLQGADLSGAYLRGTNLSGANLIGADLEGADLSRADLEGAANLEGADLRGTNLQRAYLRWAYLEDAVLDGAVLDGADLWEADLEGADLIGADLEGAALIGAKLRGTNLSGADLEGAVLDDANLREAKGITNENLEQQAYTLNGATMPNGQKYEDWLKDR